MAQTREEKLEEIEETLKRAKEEALGIQKVAVKEFGVTPTISADELKEEPPIDLSKIQTPLPDLVTEALGGIYDKSAGVTDFYTEQRERIAKLEEQMATERKGVLETMKELVTGRPTIDVAAEMKKMYAEWGIPEYFEKIKAIEPEIVSLRERLTKLDEREQTSLIAAEQRGMPMTYIRGEQALVQRQYAVQRAGISAELGAKTAIAEMYRGNIDLARSLVSDTVNALTYNVQQQRQDMEALYEFYGDYLSTLDTATQRDLANIRADLEKEEKIQREDYLAKLNLMTDAAGKGIDLGLTTQDIKDRSLEEITETYSKKVAEEPDVTTQIIGSVDTGYMQIVTDKRTGKVIRTEPITAPGVPTAGKEQEINIYARQLMAGTILPSNVPSKIRGEVLVKQTEFIKEDLRNDILMAKDRRDYVTKEELIDRLAVLYKEISKEEISTEVYGLIPDVVIPELKPTPERAGITTREALQVARYMPEAYIEAMGKVGPGIKSFFKGLFGK